MVQSGHELFLVSGEGARWNWLWSALSLPCRGENESERERGLSAGLVRYLEDLSTWFLQHMRKRAMERREASSRSWLDGISRQYKYANFAERGPGRVWLPASFDAKRGKNQGITHENTLSPL